MKVGSVVRAACLIALMGAFLSSVGAETNTSLPFAGINRTDAAVLNRGEPIIRAVRDVRELSLVPVDDRAAALRSRLGKLKPNYITELLLSLPLKDASQAAAILGDLASALADVSGYVKIPYWSVRQQMTYDLFDTIEIIKRAPIGGGESIDVRQHMEPFDTFKVRYEYQKYPGALMFSGINLESIVYSYKNLKAVAPGEMMWGLYAFAREDRLYVYGAGAVNAFDLFGLFRERLEPSFMGRVAAFFKYISQKAYQ